MGVAAVTIASRDGDRNSAGVGLRSRGRGLLDAEERPNFKCTFKIYFM